MANEEKLRPNHASPERGNREVGKVAGERLENLEKSPEAGSAEKEPSQQETAERARKQAELEAVFAEETGRERQSGGEPDALPSTKPTSKQQKDTEYKKTMKSVQHDLSKPSRAFSKVIHQPAVEKTSDAVGTTVARPNAILAGSFTAFVAISGVYLLANYNGFRLSGFETIAAFAAGWIVGVVLDLLRVAFKRRRAL